jgi:GcrA cell cycle regulator
MNGLWTTERVDTLRKLHADGMAFSLIGVQLGVSRNAVIGKASRLGLDARPHFNNAPIRKLDPEERARRLAQRNEHRNAVQRLYRKLRAPPEPLPEPTSAPPEFLGIGLLDLERNHCRYPRGEGTDILFCGQPVERGSYCGHCYRIMYVRGRPERRSQWIPSRGEAA